MLTSRTSTLQASRCRRCSRLLAGARHPVSSSRPSPTAPPWFGPARCRSIRIHWFRVTCLAEAAGGRSTSGVVEPPIAHGAAPVWAGDVRADPDEVQEVHYADVQNLNAAGFEEQEFSTQAQALDRPHPACRWHTPRARPAAQAEIACILPGAGTRPAPLLRPRY